VLLLAPAEVHDAEDLGAEQHAEGERRERHGQPYAFERRRQEPEGDGRPADDDQCRVDRHRLVLPLRNVDALHVALLVPP
jgi:hypothetical protein